MPVVRTQKTAKVPQSQFLTRWSMSLLAQFIDNYGRPCDHAETFCCDSGDASDSVHRRSQWTSCCATETGPQLPAVLGMAAVKGFFGGFSTFFALLRIVPELSASFWSPRWRNRGLPCTIIQDSVDMNTVPQWPRLKQQQEQEQEQEQQQQQQQQQQRIISNVLVVGQSNYFGLLSLPLHMSGWLGRSLLLLSAFL